MIIGELDCRDFGCLHEKKIALSPGINLITGGNEAGKSTAASFLRCMLYGMRRGRGRNAVRDDYHRLIPWNQTQAEGSLCFSCQGRNFRLHRVFADRQEKVELFCTDDGEVLDVSMGDLQMLLGGLGEGLYENVVSSRQQTELSADLWKSLENYLLNMETVQEEQTDVETAVKLLEERSRAARANGRRLEKERHQREQELNSQIRYVEQREGLLQEKIAQMEAQCRELAQKQQEQQRYPYSYEDAALENQAEKEWRHRTGTAQGAPVTETFSGMRKQKAENDTREERKGTGQKERPTSGWVWLFLLTSLVFFAGARFLFWKGQLPLAVTGIITGAISLIIFAVNKWRAGRNQNDTGMGDGAGGMSMAAGDQTESLTTGLQELSARIAQLQEELLDAGQERQNCLEELGELDRALPREQQAWLEAMAAEDARDRIRKVSAELSGNWADRLTDQASEILRAITGGRYFGIQVNTGTRNGSLTVTDGVRIYQPEQLSTGTADQIRMAVRLSAAQLLEEEPMPLVFDDAFLTWDDVRLSQLLEYLAGCGRQVLIFTGQNREELLLIGEKLSYHKIMLDENRAAVYSHTDMRYDNSILQ
ncbi:AAA family ATPase [Oscillospiraceae bacterium Marseille-Q3528]|nr:AAA family ATPase [Oscillospiraceae bacterium Marseille-Q3528]